VKRYKEVSVMRIKRKVKMNMRELLEYLLSQKDVTIYKEGHKHDGAWSSLTTTFESKVDYKCIGRSEEYDGAMMYEVIVDEEITEETILPCIVEVFIDYMPLKYDLSYANTFKNTSIKEIRSLGGSPSAAKFYLFENNNMTLLWENGSIVNL